MTLQNLVWFKFNRWEVVLVLVLMVVVVVVVVAQVVRRQFWVVVVAGSSGFEMYPLITKSRVTHL